MFENEFAFEAMNGDEFSCFEIINHGLQDLSPITRINRLVQTRLNMDCKDEQSVATRVHSSNAVDIIKIISEIITIQ